MQSPIESGAPSKVRYCVVAVCTLMAVLLYLDRFCFSFAEIFIKEDLGLTDKQIGYMLSAFNLTYAICQVPSGWLSDRFGPRLMLTSYIAIWSLFTALAGAAVGIITIVLFRFGMGIGQAGAYPTSAKIISQWMPLTARGSASGIVSAGGRMGAVIAPLLTAYLMVLLVPIGDGSEFEAGDILSVQSIAEAMADKKHQEMQFFRSFQEQLSTPSRELLDDLGSQITTIREAAGEDDERAAREIADLPAASPEQQQRLANDLNGMLAGSALYDEASFKTLEVDKQALRLIDQPAGELTSEESSRLNRLLIEAQFRSGIGKVYGRGWRPLFVIYGLSGILVTIAFWIIVRDHPRSHPRCNAGELAIIERGSMPPSSEQTKPLDGAPIREMVSNFSMWMNCLTQFTTNIGWIFLLSWFPRYLLQHHDVPVTVRGWMVSLVILVGWCGMLWGGVLTDRLVSRIGLHWGRVLPLSLSRFLAMVGFLLCLLDLPVWGTVACCALVAFGTDLGNPAIWAFSQDVGGRHVGSVLGWGNMFGNFGAVVGPVLLIAVVGDTYQWNYAFLVCGGAFLVSGLAALGIDPTTPIVKEDAAPVSA